jgi:hypothetical protein
MLKSVPIVNKALGVAKVEIVWKFKNCRLQSSAIRLKYRRLTAHVSNVIFGKANGFGPQNFQLDLLTFGPSDINTTAIVHVQIHLHKFAISKDEDVKKCRKNKK